MIYETFRPVLRFCLHQFFSEVKVKGEACEQGAVLFVANHPNFAMDAMLIATTLKRPLWFLAKATLFQRELLSRLFKACHMVPIYRRMDSVTGTVDNDEAFRVATATLSKRDALVIFPEGVSLGERKLLPLRTGAARIAFQTEEAGNFKLGLKIQPVGLIFTDLERFRSCVTLNFGEPIEISNFKKAFESDAISAVRDLTELIEQGLKKVTVEIENAGHIELVENITSIYRSRNPSGDDHALMSKIAENVALQGDSVLKSEEGLRERISAYLDMARTFSIDDSFSLGKAAPYHWYLLPFILLGLIFNYIPYRLIGFAARKFESHPVYSASLRFGLGMVVFPAWFLFLTLLFAILVGGFFASISFLALQIFCAYLVNNYLNHFKLYLLATLWPGKKKPLAILENIRDQLIQELDQFRIK